MASLRKHPLFWGGLLLTALTTLNNWPVSFFDFAWDDYGYIIRNYPIQDPVSFKTLKWCFTEFAEANWHPITWLALNIQFNCFGPDPRGYHIVNLALHIANGVLLYCALWRMTGAARKSLIVSALFAVHPLHVESVAWISEIKDMLSTFFLMLTLHAYISYSRKMTLTRYALAFSSLALGLMSKPMLVTAPFALLLLDYWPLGRWNKGPLAARQDYRPPRQGTVQLLYGKIPFVLLIVTTCILTFLAQHEAGAVADLKAISIGVRLFNTANSYVLYLSRLLWPWPLSFFYPYNSISTSRFIFCVILIAAISLAALFKIRSKPYILIGWLWFMGTLIPVIGLVQVGSQALADRYTYIPSIGIFLAAVWLASDISRRLHLSTLLPSALAVSLIFTYMLVSFEYLGHWANETELYEYALSVDDKNIAAHNNYANILAARGQYSKAIDHYNNVLKYAPTSALTLNNLARLQVTLGDTESAEKNIQAAIKANPTQYASFLSMANLKSQQHDDASAEHYLRQALALKPKAIDAIIVLADLLMQRGETNEALSLYNTGLNYTYDKDPSKAFIYNNLGIFWLKRQDYPNAMGAFEKALALQPKFLLASRNLAILLLAQHKTTMQEQLLRKTLTFAPTDPVILCLLGDLFRSRHQLGKAYVQYRRALAANDATPDAHEGIAVSLRAFGQSDLADIHAARANDFRILLRPSPQADQAKAAARKNSK